MARNDHFLFPDSWVAAGDLVAFEPIKLPSPEGSGPNSLAVHIRDHKRRDLPLRDRTLEAYYDAFTFSQRMCETPEAGKRMVVDVSYGSMPRVATVVENEARVYDGDLDPDDEEALPPVVVWHAGEMFYLLAGRTLSSDQLLVIANTLMQP